MAVAVEFSPFILFSSFLFLLFLLRLLRSKSAANGFNFPPGPPRLPLIGNLHLMSRFRPPHRTLADLAAKYGAVMHLQLGELSNVVVSSADAARAVFKDHDVTLATRPSLIFTETMFYRNTDIAFAPYGDYWRRLRRICTLEMLSVRRVQSFRPLRQESFVDLCRKIAAAGAAVNFGDLIEEATFESFMTATVGNSADQHKAFIDSVRESTVLAAGFSLADVFPSVKLFQRLSGLRSKLLKLHKSTDGMIESIIADHRAAAAAGGGGKEREDLVDVLLKFNEEGHELHLSTQNIKAVLLDMFSAGVETSATTIGWAMSEMVKNPEVLRKAQDEVRRVFEGKGFVDEANLDELKYLKMVIKETLRMHPPLPLLLPRESSEAFEIHGYKLPAKTRVMLNAWAIARDPKYWKDPNTFMPGRFLETSADFKGKDFEFIPFGAGRRMCPGLAFGLANVELPLAMFLYHFDWALPDGMTPDDMDMSECFGITARRRDALSVMPVVKIPVPAKKI
ncbi:salviol synthase-like [Andrographis paniculata]|uniref:salviol synthase-like n=1 Tax=Andrographis paniculata TaxID=175694 RepID=UPI0021E76F60|nr:salviol synthase-like [Andrographis paniculata]